MGGRGTLTIAASVVWLAGCGLGQPGRVEFSDGRQTISCGGMSSGACEEQGAAVAARHPGATLISLDCTAAACDRKGGSGTAVATLADGTKVADSFTYTGDPGSIPMPLCVGLEPVLCRSEAASAVDEAPPSKRIVRIEVRCTVASCTRDAGEADINVTFGDGSTQGYGMGWSTAGD